jgi:hypothetical protein
MGVRLSDKDEAALVAWALEAIRPGGCSGWGSEFDAALQVARRLIPYDTEGCICTETVVGKVCPVHLESMGGSVAAWHAARDKVHPNECPCDDAEPSICFCKGCCSCHAAAIAEEGGLLPESPLQRPDGICPTCGLDPKAVTAAHDESRIRIEALELEIKNVLLQCGLLGPESPSKPLSEPAPTQEQSGRQTPLEARYELSGPSIIRKLRLNAIDRLVVTIDVPSDLKRQLAALDED